jgi:hypothetical protein
LNGTGATALRVISSKAGASFSTFLQFAETQGFFVSGAATQFDTDASVLPFTGSM